MADWWENDPLVDEKPAPASTPTPASSDAFWANDPVYDPKYDDSAGQYAAQRGRQVAQGAAEGFAAIPESAAITGAAIEEQVKKSAPVAVDMRQQRITMLEDALKTNTDMPPEQRTWMESQVAALREGIAATNQQAAKPIIPAQERDVFKYGDTIRKAVEDTVGAPEKNDVSFGGMVAYGAGNAAAMITSSLAASAVGGPWAGVFVGGAHGAAMNQSQVYKEAVETGADEQTALEASNWAALVGASEIIPISRALRLFPSAARKEIADSIMQRIVELGKSGAEEGIQEYLSQVGNNLIAQQYYDPERGLTEGATEAALVGAVLGTGINAAAQTAEMISERGGSQEQKAAIDSSGNTPQTPTTPAAGNVAPDVAQAITGESLADRARRISKERQPKPETTQPPAAPAAAPAAPQPTTESQPATPASAAGTEPPAASVGVEPAAPPPVPEAAAPEATVPETTESPAAAAAAALEPAQTTNAEAKKSENFEKAVAAIQKYGKTAPNFLAARLGIGMKRAEKLLFELEDAAVVKFDTASKRFVPVTSEGNTPEVSPVDTNTVPEAPETIEAQRQALSQGKRDVVFYPDGTPPPGKAPGPNIERTKIEKLGIFDYNKVKTSPKKIREAAKAGKLNELLGLGPVNKEAVAESMAAGSPEAAVVERTPEGVEVKAAAGTAETVPEQLPALEGTKAAPENTVAVESPAKVLGDRLAQVQRPNVEVMDAPKAVAAPKAEKAKATSKARTEGKPAPAPVAAPVAEHAAPAAEAPAQPTGKPRILPDLSPETAARVAAETKAAEERREARAKQLEEIRKKDRRATDKEKNLQEVEKQVAEGGFASIEEEAVSRGTAGGSNLPSYDRDAIVKGARIAKDIYDAARGSVPDFVGDLQTMQKVGGYLREVIALAKSKYDAALAEAAAERAKEGKKLSDKQKRNLAIRAKPGYDTVTDHVIWLSEAARISKLINSEPSGPAIGKAITSINDFLQETKNLEDGGGRSMRARRKQEGEAASSKATTGGDVDKIADTKELTDDVRPAEDTGETDVVAETKAAEEEAGGRKFDTEADEASDTSLDNLDTAKSDVAVDTRSTERKRADRRREVRSLVRERRSEAPATAREVTPEVTPAKVDRSFDWPVSKIKEMSGPNFAPFAKDVAILRAWVGSLSDADYATLEKNAAYDFPKIMASTTEPGRLLAAWQETLKAGKTVTKAPGDYSKVLADTEESLAPAYSTPSKTTQNVTVETKKKRKIMKRATVGGDERFVELDEADVVQRIDLADAIAQAGEVGGNSVNQDIIKGMLARLRRVVAKVPVKVVHQETLDAMFPDRSAGNVNGYFDPQLNHIIISSDFLKGGKFDARLLAHEGVHAYLQRALDSNATLKKDFQDILDYVKSQSTRKDHYGFNDVHEFLAEALSNPAFQNRLMGMKVPKQLAAKYGVPKQGTMWHAMLRSIAKYLGLDRGDIDALSYVLSLGERAAKLADTDPDTRLIRDMQARGLWSEAKAEPIFYSAVQRVVESIKQGKAAAGQWLGMIKNAPGVKPEELEYLGLEEWLKSQDGPVTRQQVMDYIAANQLEIREVTKGEKSPYQRMVLGDKGKNYRELLITLPGNKGDSFAHAYWKGEENVVAHIRFDERTGPNGEKILFVNEMQSDWHQKGRRSGYKIGKTERTFRKTDDVRLDLQDTLARTYNLGQSAEAAMNIIVRRGRDQYEPYLTERGWPPTPEVRALVDEYFDTRDHNAAKMKGELPDAPFKTTWPELALKRMARWAADNGFDSVAWPSTPEQVARIEGWGDRLNESDGRYYLDSGASQHDVTPIIERYTTDLPRIANKLFKKFGAKTDRVGIDAGDSSNRYEGPEFSLPDLEDRYNQLDAKKEERKKRFQAIDRERKAAEEKQAAVFKSIPKAEWEGNKEIVALRDEIDALDREYDNLTEEQELDKAFRENHDDFSYYVAAEGFSFADAVVRVGNSAFARALGGKIIKKTNPDTVNVLPLPDTLKDSVKQGQPLFQKGRRPMLVQDRYEEQAQALEQQLQKEQKDINRLRQMAADQIVEAEKFGARGAKSRELRARNLRQQATARERSLSKLQQQIDNLRKRADVYRKAQEQGGGEVYFSAGRRREDNIQALITGGVEEKTAVELADFIESEVGRSIDPATIPLIISDFTKEFAKVTPGGNTGKLRRLAVKMNTLDYIRQTYDGYFNGLLDKWVKTIQKREKVVSDVAETHDKDASDIVELTRKDPEEAAKLRQIAFEATRLNVKLGQGSKANDHLDRNTKRNIQAKALLPKLEADFAALKPETRKLYARMVKNYRETHNNNIRALAYNLLTSLDLKTPLSNSDLMMLLDKTVNGTISAEDAKLIGDKKIFSALRKATSLRVMKGDYFPQMRFGDFVVLTTDIVKDPGITSVTLKGKKGRTVPVKTTVEGDTVRFAIDSDLRGSKAAFNRMVQQYIKNSDLTLLSATKGYVDRETGKMVKSGDQRIDREYDLVWSLKFQTQGVNFFESESEAKAFRKEVNDPDATKVSEVLDRRKDPMDRLISGSALSAITKNIDKRKDLKDWQRKQMRAAVQEAIISQMSGNRAQTRHMARRNVKGASKDLARAAATYGQAAGNYYASLTLSQDSREAWTALNEFESKNQMKQGAAIRSTVMDELRKREATLEDPLYLNKAMQHIATLSFLDKLLGPSHPIINFAQVLGNSFPVLGGKYGNGKAAVALMKAYDKMGALKTLGEGLGNVGKAATDWQKSMLDTTDLIGSVRKRLGEKYGPLLDELEERGLLESNAGFEIGQSVADGDGWFGTNLGKLDRLARQAPAAVEVVNRVVTAVAAYDLATSAGNSQAQAIQEAYNTVSMTQGDYRPSNNPRFMKHPALSWALQFKKYAVLQTQLYGDMYARAVKGATREEKARAAKQLANMMGVQVMMAGALGLPGLEVIKLALSVVSMAFPDFGWDEFEEWLEDTLDESIGENWSELLRKGVVTRTLGIDVSDRMSQADLWSGFVPNTLDRDGLTKYVGSLILGAPGSTMFDWADAGRELLDGNIGKALEKAVPIKVAADTVRAVNEYRRDRMTGGEAVIKSLGFQPRRMAEINDQTGREIQDAKEIKAEKNKIIKAWLDAITASDRAKVVARMREFNTRVPERQRLSLKFLNNVRNKQMQKYEEE